MSLPKLNFLPFDTLKSSLGLVLFFDSEDWFSCEPKSDKFYSYRSTDDAPIGMVVLLDCPAALQWLSDVESQGQLSSVEVFWGGVVLLKNGQHNAAVELWKHQPEIASYLMNSAKYYHYDPNMVELLTGMALGINANDWRLWLDRDNNLCAVLQLK